MLFGGRGSGTRVEAKINVTVQLYQCMKKKPDKSNERILIPGKTQRVNQVNKLKGKTFSFVPSMSASPNFLLILVM